MEEIFLDLQDLKRQLGLTQDQTDDDILLEGKIRAAENHIDRMLGYRMRERFPASSVNSASANVPRALVEAVLQLAAWWFENREAATDMSRELPFGVREIVAEHRGWTF